LQIVLDIGKVEARLRDGGQRVIRRVLAMNLKEMVQIGLKIAAPNVISELLEIGNAYRIDNFSSLSFHIVDRSFGEILDLGIGLRVIDVFAEDPKASTA